ncbi:MAG: 50S ribosomal protein L22 [bacterium]|nr:50S ribosomal protein L22 [bacterium]
MIDARVSARKARMVIDQIRGMQVAKALATLENTRRAANPIVQKVLQSAVANAVQKDGSVNVEDLIITEARVDQGRQLKRMRARAMGRGMMVRKKTSHIRLSVG